MEDAFIDEKSTDEGLYDLYLIKCINNHWTPSIGDYVIWRDEEYPEMSMTQERQDEIGYETQVDNELDNIAEEIEYPDVF
jgi:hypothetical protein